jgi:hypothetical protein
VARSVIAVIVGYLIFALSAFAFFQVSGQPPHQAAPVPVMIGSIALGMVFALLGAVATVLALGAAISLLSTMGKGAVWSQVAALVLMAPCAALGGWLRMRQVAGA